MSAPAIPRSLAALALSHTNKDLNFSREERAKLGLRGLLPPAVNSMDTQVARVLAHLRNQSTDLERHEYIMNIMDYSERLFYATLAADLAFTMPLVYTPTVGEACQQYSNIYVKPRGLYVTIDDLGDVSSVVANWPADDVRVVIVTDGERILGLGDLGANGMGIPVGKGVLYSACAAINPASVMPVTLDVGTDNKRLREDPMYIGLARPRTRGASYDALVEEFIAAVRSRYGANTIIHFEDFGNTNAFRLLQKFRDVSCCFNDDIQGTAAVCVAGILASVSATSTPIDKHRFLFLGAGMAATGIADLLVDALVKGAKLSVPDARKRMFFVDSAGLLVRNRPRGDIAPHKEPYVQDGVEWVDSMEAAVKALRPTCIIGVSAQAGTFNERVIGMMAEFNERPIIFALSNPTSKAECTAEEAYKYSKGRALFASGSPFGPVTLGGKKFVPGQCNNAFIFPGLALGLLVSKARIIPDNILLVTAETLAKLAPAENLAQGNLFPSLDAMLDVATTIAVRVAEACYADGIATAPKPDNMLAAVKAAQYSYSIKPTEPSRL